MSSHPLLNNFTGGELTTFLDARTDLAKYASGCSTMENFRPLPWGGATFRPGTQFIAEVKTSSTSKARLLPFRFSVTQTFVIELGDLYMRFYTGAGTVVSKTPPSAWVTTHAYVVGNFVLQSALIYYCVTNHTSGTFATDLAAGKWVQQSVYEIPSPYSAANVFGVQFKEINDVIYLTHPSYPVQKLSRIADDNWVLATDASGSPAIAWTNPPMLNQNTTATTLTPGAASGATTLTASTSIFTANHKGSYWQLTYISPAVSLNQIFANANLTSSSVVINGAWTFTTTGEWNGNIFIETAADGSTNWVAVNQFYSDYNGSAGTGQNFTAAGTVTAPTYFRIRFAYGVHAAGLPLVAQVDGQQNLQSGIVFVTGYTSGTVVNITVITPLWSTSATTRWCEGAFSAYRGYPQAIGLFEQRLYYGGTSYQPNTIYGSQPGDFENFNIGTGADSDALVYQFAVSQQNPINWLEAITALHAGTSGEEISVGSGYTGAALTPTNVTVRTTSSYGSSAFQPVLLDRKILFIERQGRRLREMGEIFIYANPDSVTYPDLTLHSEHILNSGVVEMDVCRLPDSLLFCTRADGQMAVFTYNREQQVAAWARYVTSGLFESCACVEGTPQDSVFVIVNRTFSGVTHRFVEKFNPYYLPPDSTTAYYLDCGDIANPGGFANVSGLSWLIGQTVAWLEDGIYKGTQVVANTSGGTITLSNASVASVQLGLPYTGTLETMKVDYNEQDGTTQTRKKRIAKVALKLKDTIGGSFSVPGQSSSENIPYDTVNTLFTGEAKMAWPGSNEHNVTVKIQQTQPYPMTVLAIMPVMQVMGD